MARYVVAVKHGVLCTHHIVCTHTVCSSCTPTLCVPPPQHTKVDMLVGDIYGGNYSAVGLSATTIASSFGKVVGGGLSLADVKPADAALAALRMIRYRGGWGSVRFAMVYCAIMCDAWHPEYENNRHTHTAQHTCNTQL